MPRFEQSTMPGLSVGLEYGVSGKVTALYVTNATGVAIYAAAVLTGGRLYSATFPDGDTKIDLPANAVTIAFPSPDEVVITGVERLVTRAA